MAFPSSAVPPQPPPSAVSWPMAAWMVLTAVAGALSALAEFLFWVTMFGVRALSWLLSGILVWPAIRLYNLACFVLSPVTLTFSYAISPLLAVPSFASKLQPLYIFLGSAAFVGVLAGLVLKVIANYVVAILQIGPQYAEDETDGPSSMRTKLVGASTKAQGTPSSALHRHSFAASSRPGATANAPEKDDVWLWLEEFKLAKPVVSDSALQEANLQPFTPKQQPGGLLSQTIVEESSTE